jgi:hypothetical protein
MTWTPTRQLHDPLCECGGEGLIPFKAKDHRGDHYLVWRICPTTGPWRPDRNAGPEMSFDEYVRRNPNWYAESAKPDWRDHEFCRHNGRAIATDPGCVAFPLDNPLHSLVAHYANSFGWVDPTWLAIEEAASTPAPEETA